MRRALRLFGVATLLLGSLSSLPAFAQGEQQDAAAQPGPIAWSPDDIPTGRFVKVWNGSPGRDIGVDSFNFHLEAFGPLPGLPLFWHKVDHTPMTGVYDPATRQNTFLLPGRIPPRSCGYELMESEQDNVFYDPTRFRSEFNHNGNGWGGFAKDFRSIDVPAFSAIRVWVYSLPKNKWYALRPPTVIEKIGLGGFLPNRIKPQNIHYNPFHDVLVYGEGRAFACHSNEMFELECGFAARTECVAAVDSRHGLYYNVRDDGTVETLDLNSESWQTLPIKPLPVCERRKNYGTAYARMTYVSRRDRMLYWDTSSDRNSHEVKNIWSLDCQTHEWKAIAVPDFLQRHSVAAVSYHPELDVALFSGQDGLYAYRLAAGRDVFKELPPPPAIAIDMSRGKVELSWQPVSGDGITGYAIYRGEASRFPKNFQQIVVTNAKTTRYTDESIKPGSKWAYRVYALRGKVQGRPSHLAYTQPLWVHGVVASVEKKNLVRVTWEQNTEPDLVGYNIYRARGADMFDWKSFQYEKLNDKPVADLKFVDTVDLSDGVARGYIVKAVNKLGVESGYSDLATTFPNPPEWVTMQEVSPGRLRITWQPPQRQKVVGVDLYCQHEKEPVNQERITDNTYEFDWDVAKQGRKWFQLRAVNVLGQIGFTSHQLSKYGRGFDGILPDEKVFRYRDFTAREKDN